MFKEKTERKYLAEFVYGAIDGTITTLAIVAGAIGASLSSAVILILGFANLFADGFSMAISNYLSKKSERDLKNRTPKNYPRKTALVTFVSFLVVGFIPLLSFVIAPFSEAIKSNQFTLSFVLTGLALITVGFVKGKVTRKNKLKSSIETLLIGGFASLIAFLTGYLLKMIIV